MIDHPRILALFLLVVMAGLAFLGSRLRSMQSRSDEDKDISLVISATLTLLGLIIGFMFSMATTRYDQRRQYEEAEANSIGTEWLRCDLMPAAQATVTRTTLQHYLDARLAFYNSEEGNRPGSVDVASSRLQSELWASVRPLAAAQPTPVTALVVNGMNDVLNSQGYTQSAWWNRIPTTAWVLLITIGCVANFLVGYGTKQKQSKTLLLIVLPALVSVAMFLISDIDSPRGGVIRIQPRDLVSLRASLGR